MFSGIIEDLGRVDKIESVNSNIDFYIHTSLLSELYIDQSISHNGVCLTVVDILKETYRVTAIKETLQKSNLGTTRVGDMVNLERSITPQTRMDGHFVQGHVDAYTECLSIQDENGSWYCTFKLPNSGSNLVVNKGSITINGVSLTVVDPDDKAFKVAIIPYTYSHTTFQYLKIGDFVNIEYDILGKYIARYMEKMTFPISGK